jgi:gluconolactonase
MTSTHLGCPVHPDFPLGPISTRYPDPRIEMLDPRFEKYWTKLAVVERISYGFRWAEGAVWVADARHLLWSDIPNNRIMKWDEASGATSVYRQPSNWANGNTRDRQGRLVTCEHGRRVTRTEYDGTLTTLAERLDGKRLNSPNDVVVKSDNSIWFTDPPFGLLANYEGDVADAELPQNVYRIDGETGRLEVAIEGIPGPNGLCFSPDESLLYVVESRAMPTRLISAFDIVDGGKRATNRRVVIDAGPGGTPDGMRCDVDGNLWCGWGMGREDLDGVRVFAPDGTPLAHIRLPERCANVCFGGRKRNRLFMAASQSVYALYVNTQGTLGG